MHFIPILMAWPPFLVPWTSGHQEHTVQWKRVWLPRPRRSLFYCATNPPTHQPKPDFSSWRSSNPGLEQPKPLIHQLYLLFIIRGLFTQASRLSGIPVTSPHTSLKQIMGEIWLWISNNIVDVRIINHISFYLFQSICDENLNHCWPSQSG